MVEPSKRIRQAPESAIRKLHDLSVSAEKRGIFVYRVNIGQPDIPTPPSMLKALQDHKVDLVPYTPSRGLASYIEKLVAYYKRLGLDVAAEDIIVTTGGSEGLYFAMLACGDPGDEIIVPEPYYTNYNTFAVMCGLAVVPVTSRIEDGFRLPPTADFEKKISARTCAVLICSPNNPTGTVYTQDQLDALAALCRKHNLFLISDEAYCEITLHPNQSLLHRSDVDENLIVVESVSKRYNTCGARVGRVVSRNRAVMAEIMKLAQVRLSVSYPGQILAQAALDLDDGYVRSVAEEYDARIEATCRELAKIPGVKYHRSQGAFYIMAKLPVDDAEKFARFTLGEFHSVNPANGRKETVMLTPGEGFYKTPGLGRDEVRIACVFGRDDMARSARILAESLAAYRR